MTAPVPLLVGDRGLAFCRSAAGSGARLRRSCSRWRCSCSGFVGLGDQHLARRRARPRHDLGGRRARRRARSSCWSAPRVLIPIILAYTGWAYWVFRGKVGARGLSLMKVRVALRIFAISLALCIAAPAAAQPAAAPIERLADIPNVQIQYYDVTGQTEAAIRASMNAGRPRDAISGQRIDANVHWTISWGWPLDGRGGCDLSRATVTFNATVTMPRLTGEERLPEALRNGWRASILGLERHLTRPSRPSLRAPLGGARCNQGQHLPARRSSSAGSHAALVAGTMRLMIARRGAARPRARSFRWSGAIDCWHGR